MTRHIAVTAPAMPLSWHDHGAAAPREPSLRRLALSSLLTIALGFGGFLLWASQAQIESAVPANGLIVSAGKRKTVSLADSGVLSALLVHEGDSVTKGQILFRLDDVQMRTAYAQANVLFWSATARAARLDAEAQDLRSMTISDAVTAAMQDPAVAAGVKAEQDQFQARWAAIDTALGVEGRRIAQQQAQVGSLRAQLGGLTEHLALSQEELRDVNTLYARGLETKPRRLELQAGVADMRGQTGQIQGQLTQALQTIAQTVIETRGLLDNRRADISKDRADTQAALADAVQRRRAALDLLDKREIISPETGTVTDIKFFTPGSAIGAGQPVLDIVPSGARLLVEGNVAPGDIEHLAIGQRVNVRLTAYKAHRVGTLPGRLVYVGADRQLDPSNNPVFLVRAELDPDALKSQPGVVLYPGMPADVLIINGARSVLTFFIGPIRDSIRHSMNEE